MRPPGNTLLRGKSTQDRVANVTNAHSNMDPTKEASLVAADWHGSAESQILACVRIRGDILTFEKDQAALRAFLAALVDDHVLPRAEAKFGRAAPKLCKLIKIGEHADLLQRKEIIPFLEPGYTTLYQLVVLAEELPKDKEPRVTELLRILTNCRGEVSRDFLIEETRRRKQARGAAKRVAAARVTGEPSAAAQTLPALIEAGEQFELVLLTPGERDLARLRADYADGSTLERCLPQLKRIEHSAAVVIVARISDMPLLANVLLPLCGFPRLSRVLLARQPTSPDVTEAEIFVTAGRGEIALSAPEDAKWLDDPIDSAAIAARLFPAASRRLHVFASAQTTGWCCLVGDDSWAEEPSLR